MPYHTLLEFLSTIQLYLQRNKVAKSDAGNLHGIFIALVKQCLYLHNPVNLEAINQSMTVTD
jgi:hypothetical protein